MRKLVIWLTAAAVAIAGIVLAASATAKGEKATVGPSVVGIHAPCPTTHPWPGDKAPISEITKQLSDNFGVTLAGNGWTDANRTQISVVWQALDAVSCTDFLANLKAKVSGTIGINAAHMQQLRLTLILITPTALEYLDATLKEQGYSPRQTLPTA